jgi:hypothetical protein
VWIIGVAVILLCLEEAVRRGKKSATVSDLEGTLLDTLPSRLAQWSRELAIAGEASCPPTVDLTHWTVAFAFVIDHESAGGNTLRPRGAQGLGDFGHGHGLGQVDDRPAHDGAGDFERQLSAKRLAHIASGDWEDPEKHLTFCAVEVLRGAWEQFPDLDGDARLAAAVASYNSGVDNVTALLEAGLDVDGHTTGRNYSSQILAQVDAAEQGVS